MEDYRIFEEEPFNKVLDLVEYVDEEAAAQFSSIIKVLPKKIIKALSEGDDFELLTEKYNSDLLRMNDGNKDSIFFTFKSNIKNIGVQISIIPFREMDLMHVENNIDSEEFQTDDGPWFTFSITLTTGDKNYDWEVYVQEMEGAYQVISCKNINEKPIRQIVENLSYGEIMQYVNDSEYDEDEEYEDENDIEFDGVMEYDEVTGELKITSFFENEDVKIDEESGEPEVKVEFIIEELEDEEDYEP